MDDQIKLGDTFTMDLPVYRKWWQFWRPRILRYERRAFTVSHVSQIP